MPAAGLCAPILRASWPAAQSCRMGWLAAVGPPLPGGWSPAGLQCRLAGRRQREQRCCHGCGRARPPGRHPGTPQTAGRGAAAPSWHAGGGAGLLGPQRLVTPSRGLPALPHWRRHQVPTQRLAALGGPSLHAACWPGGPRCRACGRSGGRGLGRSAGRGLRPPAWRKRSWSCQVRAIDGKCCGGRLGTGDPCSGRQHGRRMSCSPLPSAATAAGMGFVVVIVACAYCACRHCTGLQHALCYACTQAAGCTACKPLPACSPSTPY